MECTEVMRSVIQASRNPLTMRELFTRTMRIMGDSGNADEMARRCGCEPDDIVYKGENFTPVIGLVK